MINPREFLEAGQKFHGHKCPAMPLGLRAGAEAMNKLGVDRATDSQIVALVELGDGHCAHCFADGIQMITGCTFGKGNIRQLGYGKFGLILVEAATGRAVRVVPRAESQMAIKATPFFTEYRQKGVPASKVPADVVEPLIARVLDSPVEQIYKVSDVFEYDLGKGPDDYNSFVCEVCGDMVIESYGRFFEGKKVCIPCQQELLLEGK